MAASNPPVNAVAFIAYVALQDMANPGSYKASPTLAAGDVKVSIDGGASANLATLPSVLPAAGIAVKVPLSAAEMTGDNIFVQFIDQTNPKEWADYAFNIQTVAAIWLAPTTPGRLLDVSATGEAGVDWANVGSPTTTVDLSGTTIKTTQVVASVTGAVGSVTGAVGSVTGAVGSVAAGGITASSFAADAITAAKIADGAIDAATFAAGAINAAAIAADAITAAKVADGTIDAATFAAGAINAAAIAADAITAAKVADGTIDTATFAAGTTIPRVTLADTLTTYTGNTPQTGDSFARIGVAGAGLTNIDLPNQTMDIVGNITGNLSGSVGSVTGNVGGNVNGNVSGSVASVTGNVAGSVASVVADVGITQGGADKVWSSAARTLTSFGTLVADIWASATRTLTSFGTLTADAADKFLGRNQAGGSDGGRTVGSSLLVLRNKRTIAGGTLTVYEEDDVTPAWTATVATAPSNPVSSIDPT